MHFISALLKKHYDCKAYIVTVFVVIFNCKTNSLYLLEWTLLCIRLSSHWLAANAFTRFVLITCHHDHLRSITPHVRDIVSQHKHLFSFFSRQSSDERVCGDALTTARLETGILLPHVLLDHPVPLGLTTGK